MKHRHVPSGLQRGLDLAVDSQWSPEQVVAVVELLDDLRSVIWAHYEAVPLASCRKDRQSRCEVEHADPPF